MKNAFVTFIIRNDSFLPGALTLAYALKRQKTTHDLVVIVSKGLPFQSLDALRELYDHVIELDEIYVAHENRHERQDRPFLFSRFHALRLGKDGDLGFNYGKIILCDADLLPLKNYDDLFNLNAPAGIINEKKEYCMEYEHGKYIIPDSALEKGEWNWHAIYKDYPMGSRIPKTITDRVKTDFDNMGMNASLYLFEPSYALYKDILNDTLDKNTQSLIAKFPWPEMQYITQKLSGKWHNIDLKYSSFNGYPNIEILNGIHYAGLKPWKMRHRSIKNFARFEDYRLYYQVFITMMDLNPSLFNSKKLKRLYNQITELLKENKFQFKRTHLPNVKHLF